MSASMAWGLAGVLALVWAAVHCHFGGRGVARPLLAAGDLAREPKYVSYYCWHLVSISLVLMGVLFLWPALAGGPAEMAWLGSIMSALYAGWGIVLPLLARGSGLNYRELPQGWLFVPIALAGFWGCFGGAV